MHLLLKSQNRSQPLKRLKAEDELHATSTRLPVGLKRRVLKVVVEVKANNFNSKGELINAIEASSKLTKADAGRISQNDEDSITITGSDCGNPVLTADYRSTSHGVGEKETEVEIDLKGKIFNEEKKQIVDGFSAQSKLKTVFGGKNQNEVTEDWHRLKAEKDCKAGCAKVESHYTTKTNVTE